MLEPENTVISKRYRLVRRLRRGGMSEVFLAIDEQTQAAVAIKLVNDPECIKRLQREVHILRALSHEHILPLLDDGAFGGHHYLVMPYMARGNLRERLMQGKMTQGEASRILDQLASALQYAHEHAILHRDIKPSNILLNESEKDYIYLADFGLAKRVGENTTITQTGCLIGTPEYMAPELADMPESVSSDIYALGILLYQMLTGQLPFTGATPIATYWKHIQEQPALPSTLNPAISCAVEQVILRAIDKDPQRRFTGANDMARAYSKALHTPLQLRTFAAMQTLPPVSITFYPVKKATPAKPYSDQGGDKPRPYPARSGSVDSYRVRAGLVPALDGRPAARIPVLPQRHQTRHPIQKGLLTLAAFIFLAVPISLGFLLSKNGVQGNPALGANAAYVEKAIPPLHTTHTKIKATPTAQPPSYIAQAASQSGGLSANPPKPVRSPKPVPPPAPHGNHKHGHGHQHGHGG